MRERERENSSGYLVEQLLLFSIGSFPWALFGLFARDEKRVKSSRPEQTLSAWSCQFLWLRPAHEGPLANPCRTRERSMVWEVKQTPVPLLRSLLLLRIFRRFGCWCLYRNLDNRNEFRCRCQRRRCGHGGRGRRCRFHCLHRNGCIVQSNGQRQGKEK